MELLKIKSEREYEISGVKSSCSRLKEKIASFMRFPDLRNVAQNRFHGSVASVLYLPPENRCWAYALELCIGGRMHNWVVDSETDASQLMQTASNKAHRMTVLPLAKIQGRSIARHILDKISQKASQFPNSCALPASSVIAPRDPKFSPIIDFIFGNIILTDNKELARAIAFDKNIKIKCVTKEGDIYDPSGTMTGGAKCHNPSNSPSYTTIACFSEYHDVNAKIDDMKSFLEDKVNTPLQAHASVSSLLANLNSQLSLENDALMLLSKKLSKNDHFLELRALEKDSAELDACLKQKTLLADSISHLSERVSSLSEERISLCADLSRESKLANITSEIEALVVRKASLDKEKAQLLESIAQQDLQAKILAEKKLLHERSKADLQMQLKQSKLQLEALSETGKTIQGSFSRAQEIDHKLKSELLFEKNEEQCLKEELAKVSSRISQNHSSIKKTRAELNSSKESIDSCILAINRLLKEAPQLASASFASVGSTSHIELDSKVQALRIKISEIREKIAKKSAEISFNSSKSKDSSLIQMIDSLERQESHLQKNLSRVKLDKQKIEEAIGKLNDFRESALKDTFSRVNKDFGEIIGVLLPQSFAELNFEGKSIADGVNIRIRLGSVWKNSLNELSGGQK